MGTRLAWTATLLAVPLASIASCTSSPGGEEVVSQDGVADQAALAGIRQHPFIELCGRIRPGGGLRRCHAKVRVDDQGDVVQEAAPSGLGPADLHSAYNLPASGGSGKTVAVVDAFDNPNAESELATYRSQFGLSPCTSANGCFKKVAQDGSSNLPPADSGWAGEIALDIEMVSAVCPACKILLVEANSTSDSDLGAAVNRAAAMGASAISNSYGGDEGSGDEQAYNHPGIVVTASSGDSGYGPQFPATSQFVLAVGGTKLTKSTSSRGWAESAWSSAGSGCSGVIAKPSWQTDTGCNKRTEADVSAVADPNTGVAVFFNGSWGLFGGTSASAPIVASSYTLLGVGGQNPAAFTWSHTSDFFDVTSGSNGSCSPAYLCNSGAGYDGPTGWGTPNGALLASGGSSSSSSGSASGSTSSSSSGSSSSSSGSSSSSSGSSSSSSGSTSSSSSGSSSSSSGSTSSSSSSGSGSSSGGSGTCSHSECSAGTRLKSGCDSCVTKLCAKDSYCCNHLWDSICVGEVGSICGESCSGTSCAHNVCTAGAALATTCGACEAALCANDPYCCNSAWDNICVGEVKTFCSGQTCP